MSVRKNILGVPVDMVNMDGAKVIFDDIMNTEGVGVIVTPNSEIVVNAGKDDELKEIIVNADLVIPDGSREIGRASCRERV